MKTSQPLFLIFVLFSLFLSCKDKNDTIYHNLSYDEIESIAQKYNCGFCIVLSDSACNACDIFLDSLNNAYKKLNEKAVFNIVYTNQTKNEWYKHWLYTPASPLTCIFAADGNLVNIVAGSSLESFQCIEMSIDGYQQCSTYFHKPIFSHITDKKETLQILNDILKCKLAFEKGKDITVPIEHTLNTVWYPYNVYLECINEMKNGNINNARYIAQQLLTFEENAYCKFLYPSIFLEANKIIEPNYLNLKDAELFIMSDTVKLGNCKINNSKHFSLRLANIGEKKLNIREIHRDNECIEILNSGFFTIKPNEFIDVDFIFTPVDRGYKEYRIKFINNGFNREKIVSINANVN